MLLISKKHQNYISFQFSFFCFHQDYIIHFNNMNCFFLLYIYIYIFPFLTRSLRELIKMISACCKYSHQNLLTAFDKPKNYIQGISRVNRILFKTTQTKTIIIASKSSRTSFEYILITERTYKCAWFLCIAN